MSVLAVSVTAHTHLPGMRGRGEAGEGLHRHQAADHQLLSPLTLELSSSCLRNAISYLMSNHIIAAMLLFPGSCWLVTQTLTDVAAVPVWPSLICHNEVIFPSSTIQVFMNYKIKTILAPRLCPAHVSHRITAGPASRPQHQCGEIKGKIHPFIHRLSC